MRPQRFENRTRIKENRVTPLYLPTVLWPQNRLCPRLGYCASHHSWE
jgi:hypothetical protein